jgi:hypothetical protein
MHQPYKILAGTSEAGGAECLLPVVHHLLSRNYDVQLIAGTNAEKIFQRGGIVAKTITKDIPELTEEMLNLVKPDAVLTGILGAKDNTDYSLIRSAKRQHIPVLSILDSWMNYGDRVHDPVTGDRHGLLPTMIAVMDKIALKEALFEGIPANSCVITGHPKFDVLHEIKIKKHDSSLRATLLDKYHIPPDNFIIVFFSQPISQYYPSKYLGYNEEDVFLILFSAFEDLKREIPCTLVFKEHPRGTSLSPRIKRPARDFIYLTEADADELIILADAIAGISSTLLVFAAAAGIHVFSIQPNLREGKDLNVLTRSGYHKPFGSSVDLYSALVKITQSGKEKGPANMPDWLISDGAVCRRIEMLLRNLIERN